MAKKGANIKGKLRTCPNGHQYYKSSDCPVCPICENVVQPKEEILSAVSAPARRALENAGIKTPQKLSKFTIDQLLELHGIGPSSIPRLTRVLKANGLTFRRK